MKIAVKDLSSNQKEMVITIPWEEMEKDYTDFAKKFCKKIEMPGFRKGKVPLSLVERQYGPRIDLDFINEKFSDYYGKALNEKKINPVSQPEITDFDFKKTSPLKMTVKFDIMPEWDMPDYKGMKLTKSVFSVTEDDVEEQLKALREKSAEVKPVEGEAESGHTIIADVEQLDDENREALNEKKQNKIVLGEKPFTGETEKALLGIRAGETREVTIPSEDNKKELLKFRIKATSVEEHILPELNDEFAKTVDENLENLEELKKRLKSELKNQWETQSDRKLEEDIADFFIEKLKDVDLPEGIVKEQAKAIVEDMKKRYPMPEDVDEESIVKNYMDTAEKSIKWQLVKNKIVQENELNVTDKDLDAKIDDMLVNVDEKMRDTYKQYYKSPQFAEQIRGDIMNDKILAHIREIADIKTKKLSRKQRIEEMGS